MENFHFPFPSERRQQRVNTLYIVRTLEMKYIPSEKIKEEKIESRAIEKMSPWTINDGSFEKILNNYKTKDNQGAILDISAGSGATLKIAEPHFSKLYGVDLVSYLAPEIKPKVEFSVVDLNFDKLPHPDNFFEMVTAFQVIEHLENPFFVMREAARVLKKGSLFVLSVPNPYHLSFKIKYLFTNNMPPWTRDNNHLLFLTKAVFAKTYLENFDLVETIYQSGAIPFWGRLRLIFGKLIKKHAMVLPRWEIFGRRVCCLLRKK